MSGPDIPGFDVSGIADSHRRHGDYKLDALRFDELSGGDKPGKSGIPTSCNPAETAKLWISNVPADIQQGATSGKGKVTMKIDPYFKKGDCIHTTCVIFATNDHQASQDRSEDQAIKFRFS